MNTDRPQSRPSEPGEPGHCLQCLFVGPCAEVEDARSALLAVMPSG